METTRDEAQLQEVRGKIQALYVARGDDLSLPVHYHVLLKLEAALLGRVKPQLATV